MATKVCIYRDCENKSNTVGYTFFSFPLKDEEKCRLWAERADFALQPQRNHYLCEAHFSPIYLSKTPRRTILLPTAVPYHYAERNSTDQHNTKNEEQFDEVDPFDEENCDYLDDDNAEVKTNIAQVVADNTEEKPKISLLQLPPGMRVVPVSELKKKKLTQQLTRVPKPAAIVQTQITTAATAAAAAAVPVMTTTDPIEAVKKRKLLPDNEVTTLTVPATLEEPITEVEIVIDNISATPEISSFIFRDEECLQMPKRLYLDQRAKLIGEIQKYKAIVDKMRQVLNENTV